MMRALRSGLDQQATRSKRWTVRGALAGSRDGRSVTGLDRRGSGRIRPLPTRPWPRRSRASSNVAVDRLRYVADDDGGARCHGFVIAPTQTRSGRALSWQSVRSARYRGVVSRPLLTLGYGNRQLDDVLGLLHTHEVRYLVDVRSAPYSRFNPAFSRGNLEAALEDAGIRYVFMGDTLGGRPGDASCYDEAGHVDYLACRDSADFKAGFERLRSAFEQDVGAAIFCSELRPEHCHRTKLIGEALAEMGVTVEHIDANGSRTSHGTVMKRLHDDQMSLVGTPNRATRSRRAVATAP